MCNLVKKSEGGGMFLLSRGDGIGMGGSIGMGGGGYVHHIQYFISGAVKAGTTSAIPLTYT